MTCWCFQPRALPPLVHWIHLLSRSWLLQYSSLYCIANFPLFTGLFPSAYPCTVIPSVLNRRVASVHYLQFFCYFSHMSPPSHVLSPSLYQNYPGHKWLPRGWAQWSRLSPQQQHLTRWSLSRNTCFLGSRNTPLTSYVFSLFFFSQTTFYWSIVDLQCCVAEKWFSFLYILFQILFYYTLLNIVLCAIQ